jgi:hypothetical protein
MKRGVKEPHLWEPGVSRGKNGVPNSPVQPWMREAHRRAIIASFLRSSGNSEDGRGGATSDKESNDS